MRFRGNAKVLAEGKLKSYGISEWDTHGRQTWLALLRAAAAGCTAGSFSLRLRPTRRLPTHCSLVGALVESHFCSRCTAGS